MRIDLFTLFPGWFDWLSEQRHIRNSLDQGSELHTFDMRETSPLKGGRVDDAPYGGGAGMVMRVDVVAAALDAAYAEASPRPGRVIALAASGRRLDEGLVGELAAESHLALICGRYEGLDERVHSQLATDVVSIGPYVLAGGEPAAMVVVDAVMRKLPGALGHVESALSESFSDALDGLPEYPQYTRPERHGGKSVPEVLLSGDHARIAAWRRERSVERGARLEAESRARGGEGR